MMEFLSQEEKYKLLYEFNNTKYPYPKEKTVHQLIEEQVKRTSDSTALVFGQKELTYNELNVRANCVAERLRAEGVGKDCIVAIMVKRSFEMIISILGILKAGGAYLPIDPEYPNERVSFMLEDSSSKVLLTSADLINKASFDGKVILLNEIEFSEKECDNLPIENCSDNLAYILYTSGSTGKPKGVMISHKALNNFINGMAKEIDFSYGKSILAVTTMCFDIFALETLLPLSFGMRVVIANEEQQINAKLLGELIQSNSIDIIQMTPSRMKLLLSSDSAANSLKNVKEIIVGGEIFPETLLMNIQQRTNGKIINVYGPTETTVWSTFKELKSSESINIGRPIANTSIYILDENDNLVPIGEQGELCIGGDGLAKGYLNRAELTAEKFVLNPFIEGERMYRTGDLAKWLPDGSIEFIGRADRQIKIRGYRIELGEIEKQILQYPAIKDVVVIVEKSETDKAVLCAYVVLKEKLNLKELREFLLRSLPTYMVPTFFVEIKHIPLTLNGKLDTKSLPNFQSEFMRDEADSNQLPEDEIDFKIINICKQILGIQNINIKDNFFEIGGDSLGVLLLITEVYKQFGIDIGHSEAFRFKNLKEFSDYIKNKESKQAEIIRNEHSKGNIYNVSYVQANLIRGMSAFKDQSLMNMPFEIDFGNRIDIDELERAINLLIQRNEILRTSFHCKGSKYIQMIHKELKCKIEYLNINDTPWEAAILENIKPFDSAKVPLFKFILMENIEGKQRLFFNIHHYIFDIFSLNILLSEIVSLYQEESLNEVKIQYKDYSEWQLKKLNSKGFKLQKEYWLSIFEGWTEKVKLKKDFQNVISVQLETDSVELELNEVINEGLKRAALKTHITEFVILFSAFSIFLSRQTGLEDIVVGTFVPGRTNAQLRNAIGLFTNIVAVRTKPLSDKLFDEYAKEVKEFFIEMYNYQDYPIEKLIDDLNQENFSSDNELFTIMFDYINLNSGNLYFNGEKVKTRYYDISKTAYDIHFQILDFYDKKKLIMQYNSLQFKRSTVEGFLSEYLNILAQIANGFDKELRELS